MKLFLAPNVFTETQTDQAKECVRVLEDKCGHDCALSPEVSEKLFGDTRNARFSPEESDMIVSLGGDGAVLRAAQTAIRCKKPLLGINNGRLGYLCALNYSELESFNGLLPGLKHSERQLLRLKYHNEERLALNDVIIGKQNFGETVDLDIHVSDNTPLRVRGDGVIIATPTGSTAYNLSAGGPMLDVKLPAVLITPVCAHEPNTHPLVISNDTQIKVSVHHGSANVYADGTSLGSLEGELFVLRSEEKMLLYVKSDVPNRDESAQEGGKWTI